MNNGKVLTYVNINMKLYRFNLESISALAKYYEQSWALPLQVAVIRYSLLSE
jgi:hypothetical protein